MPARANVGAGKDKNGTHSTIRRAEIQPGEHSESVENLIPYVDMSTMAEASTAPGEAALEQGADLTLGKRVLRKIDMRLVPLMFITYTLNFMDKTILSSASVFGLEDDTVRLSRDKLSAGLTSILGTSGPAVQLGLFGFLLRLLRVVISNHPAHCPAADWEILDCQHSLLGRRSRPHRSMYQLRWSRDSPLPPRSCRGYYHSSVHVYHLELVYSR